MSIIDKINVKGNEYEFSDSKSRTDIITLKSQVSALASGSPKGTYATLSSLRTAHPIGDGNIYVVRADGCWYYWDTETSDWVSGGTFITNTDNIKRTIAFSLTGDLEVGESVMSVIVPYNMTIDNVKYSMDGIPSGASVLIDLHKNGTSIYTTQANRPEINDGSIHTGTLPDIITLAEGDKLTLEVDQVGTVVKGFGLSLSVNCTEII